MNLNIKKIGLLIILSFLLMVIFLMFSYMNSINALKTLGYTKKQSADLIKPTNILTVGKHQEDKLKKELSNQLYMSQEKIGVPFDYATIQSSPLIKQIKIIEKSNKKKTTLLNEEINEYRNYLALKNVEYELIVKTPVYKLTVFNDLIKYHQKFSEKIEYTSSKPTTLLEEKESLLMVLNHRFNQLKTVALETGVDPAFFDSLDENIIKKSTALEDEINRVKNKKEEEKKALQQQSLAQVSESGNTTLPTSGAITYINGILIVNKKHPLPPSYNPGENATAGSEARRLIAAMQSQGLDVSNGYSGFRSYAYQASLYQGYVNQDGQANADRYSARPGHSEHQTGLAFDLRHQSGQLISNTREADWLRAHSHEYGFIVRYLPGKESITGYMAEPWHLRYIGPQASAIAGSGLTLEEYLGVPGGGY